MRRFLVYSISILAAAIAMMAANDLLNIALIEASPSSNPGKMRRLFANPEPDEIAILGSSRAQAGFVPGEISPHAFNYGLNGSSFRETVFHLKEVLARPGAAPVIVNLDHWGLNNGGFTGDYSLAWFSESVRSEPKISVPLADRIPLLRFQGGTRQNFSQYLNDRMAVTKTMERGAILERISRSEAEWDYIISKCDRTAFFSDDETKALLTDALCHRGNHPIVFVVSPISSPWLERFDGAEGLEALKAWLSAFEGVRVLDFSSSGEYPLSDFMDLTHLNETGARKFSRALAAGIGSGL
ncbi:MAG: SGNH/GDSL hydrolase family protein [Kiritimatiellae bacterium]|nr:SGNH/GDSL hydrolase family protein [Kiritimatiellia bacterium]